MQTAPALGEEALIRPGIGIGIMSCSGFKSYMEKTQDDHKTDVFVDIMLNAKIRITDNWGVVPAVEMFLTPEAATETDGFAAASLSVRYSFTQEPSLYLQAGPNYSFDTSRLEVKGGLGGVASLGYAFKSRDRSRFGPELEIGYSYLPVDAAPKSPYYHNMSGATPPSSANFGGPFLRLGFRF